MCGFFLAVINKKHPHGRGEDAAGPGFPHRALETPPRAWGRQEFSLMSRRPGRNTPTGVGKTWNSEVAMPEKEKHPHGRGEDT